MAQAVLEGMKASKVRTNHQYYFHFRQAAIERTWCFKYHSRCGRQLGEDLVNEVAQFGITVNNVLPGATNTDRLQSLIENKAKKTNILLT